MRDAHATVFLSGAALARIEPSDQANLWSQPVIGAEVDDGEKEELRIAYVALTRAERYCAVALPSKVEEASLQAYLGAGFVQA